LLISTGVIALIFIIVIVLANSKIKKAVKNGEFLDKQKKKVEKR
jgi:Tfp pilus assembly protein PilN